MTLAPPPTHLTLDTFPTDLTAAAWGNPPWPGKFTSFRAHQIDAICQIVNHFDNGADVVLLDAPCGSGKTLVAEGVRRLLDVERALYCPDTKGLQTQFCSDFTYSKLLKGRSNFATLDHPQAFWDKFSPITAADCAKRKEKLPACGSCTASTEIEIPHCLLCHPVSRCPYTVAKNEAVNSALAVLNTSYFIAEANSGAQFSGADLVVIDEADVLESALMNRVEVFISARRQKELGITPPTLKTVPESWLTWVNEEAIPRIAEHLSRVRSRLREKSTDVETLRHNKYLSELMSKLILLRSSLEEGNAVYDGYEKGDIRFQPVHVAPFGPSMIWQHGQKFLLMSATIIDPLEMVESLGIERAGKRWELVKVDSTFPAERRPVHVKHACEMTYKGKDEAWPKMAAMVKRVLTEKHPTGRVLIHTVSYQFTQYLYDQLRTIGRPVLLYQDAKGRADALETYKRIEGSVLLAPSMERGVDLPLDLCEAVIITKTPWPSLGDKRVNARKYSKGGQQWYLVQAIRKLIQMSGRGMRCFSLDTEILTVDGWKSHETIRVGDVAYGMRDLNGAREGSPVLARNPVSGVVVNDHPEPVLRFKGKSIDAIVTPDHSMVIQPVKVSTYDFAGQTQTHKWKGGPFKKVAARDVPARFKIPLAGKVARHPIRLDSRNDAWFWLMGIIITDGWFQADGAVVGIAQAKPWIGDQIDEHLNDLGIQFKKYCVQDAGGLMTVDGEKFYERNWPKYNWIISGYDAARIRDIFECGRRRRYSTVRQYRKASHKGVDGWKVVPHKTIPRWILDRACVSQMRELLGGLMAGDGTWGEESFSGTFYTADETTKDRVQELLVLSGFRSSVTHRSPMWDIGFTRNAATDCPRSVLTFDAPQRTWCVNTDLGTVVARRAGKTFIAGNSEDDRCDIYILDASFTKSVWKSGKNLLPKWWKDSIDWTGGGL